MLPRELPLPGWCRCHRPRTFWWAPSSFRRRWRHLCLRRPGAPSTGDCFSFFSVGQIVDGLSMAQIHPDGRSGVVVFAAQPCYGSDDGGLGGCCFDSRPGVGGSKLLLLTSSPVRLRKMNRSFRDSFVIFFLFGVLVVKGELYCSMFNIASLSQKKSFSFSPFINSLPHQIFAYVAS